MHTLPRLSPAATHRVVTGGAVVVVAAVLNVGIARGLTSTPRFVPLVVGLALLPFLAIAFGALVERHRDVLAWAAFALPLTSLPVFYYPVPLPGGTAIFWSDLLALLALGSWLAQRLLRSAVAPPRPVNRLLGLLLVPLAFSIALGVYRGSARYDASLIGQPFRIVLYAALALALLNVTPQRAWRALTIVFYAGAVVQTLWAAYFLATGGSQTDQVILSTGGSRILAGSTAIFLTGSLVCALLNLELDQRAGRQAAHGLVAGLATFGIILTFSRATWAVVALIVVLLLVTRRHLRRAVFHYLPLAAVVLTTAALVVSLALPTLLPTLTARVGGTSGEDQNVRWRQLAAEVALEGVDEDPWRGVGFGRESSFFINGQIVQIRGDPHNSYVYLLAGGGLLALGSFLLVFAAYLLDALRRLARVGGTPQALLTWSLAMWLTFAANALAGPIFSDPALVACLWVVMALPGVVAFKARDSEGNATAPSPPPARTP